MKRTLLLFPLIISPGFAAAESIQHEVSGSLGYYEDESRYGESDDAYGANYRSLYYSANLTYYLSELDTTGVVQRELAFMRRASYGSASGYRTEYKARYFGLESWGDDSQKHDNSQIALRGNYFLNDDVFAVGGYSSELAPDMDGSLFGGLGYYYGENAAVSASLSHSLDSDDTYVQVLTHAVAGLSGDRSVAYTLGGSANVDHVSESAFLDLGATYYFSNYTGVGIAADYHIDSEEYYYDLEASHYLSDRLGIVASISDPDEGLNNIRVEATYRF